jgi:hypothetical protein
MINQPASYGSLMESSKPWWNHPDRATHSPWFMAASPLLGSRLRWLRGCWSTAAWIDQHCWGIDWCPPIAPIRAACCQHEGGPDLGCFNLDFRDHDRYLPRFWAGWFWWNKCKEMKEPEKTKGLRNLVQIPNQI